MYDREKEARETLYEIEQVIRSRPPRSTIRHETDENIEWFGMAQAVIDRWDINKSISFDGYIKAIHHIQTGPVNTGYINMMVMLNQARYSLRMYLDPATDIMIEAGGTYQYFEEIRRLIELSTSEIFFIDPYINADFVSKYLVHIKDGVRVRILTKEYIPTLIPAVKAFVDQHKKKVEVRSAKELHDRYVITDKKSCYQSGASFKDGAKNAPTTLVEIHDVFPAVLASYESIWNEAKDEL